MSEINELEHDIEEYEPFLGSPSEGEIRWIDGIKFEFNEGMWVEV